MALQINSDMNLGMKMKEPAMKIPSMTDSVTAETKSACIVRARTLTNQARKEGHVRKTF